MSGCLPLALVYVRLGAGCPWHPSAVLHVGFDHCCCRLSTTVRSRCVSSYSPGKSPQRCEGCSLILCPPSPSGACIQNLCERMDASDFWSVSSFASVLIQHSTSYQRPRREYKDHWMFLRIQSPYSPSSVTRDRSCGSARKDSAPAARNGSCNSV
jgi:hypothetical protein